MNDCDRIEIPLYELPWGIGHIISVQQTQDRQTRHNVTSIQKLTPKTTLLSNFWKLFSKLEPDLSPK